MFKKISEIPNVHLQNNIFVLFQNEISEYNFFLTLEEVLLELENKNFVELDNQEEVEFSGKFEDIFDKILKNKENIEFSLIKINVDTSRNFEVQVIECFNCQDKRTTEIKDTFQKGLKNNQTVLQQVESYRNELIKNTLSSKLVDFKELSLYLYEKNKFNRTRNNQINFNPQVKKQAIFILDTNKLNQKNLNDGILCDYNFMSELGLINNSIIENGALEGLGDNEIAEQEKSRIIRESLYKLAKAEKDSQRIYGKSSVFLIRGVVKYQKLNSKNVWEDKIAPLFLVPVRGIKNNEHDSRLIDRLNPGLNFEDYGILNYVFDYQISFAIKNIIQIEKPAFEEINKHIENIQQTQDNGIGIPAFDRYRNFMFENKSYISFLDGFNSVYGDGVWTDIIEGVEKNDENNKIVKILNGNFGIQANPQNEESLTSLDPSQEKAMRYAVQPDNEITIIKGPPGTGKSQVIVSILSKIIQQGQGKTALFVSSKKTALEVVTKKITEVENDLDKNLDQNNENKKSLNDRILDLTNSSARYNNYFSNRLAESNRKDDYDHRFGIVDNNLQEYKELIQQRQFGQISDLETKYGLLTELARFKTKYLPFETVVLSPRLELPEIRLNELEQLIDNVIASGFEVYSKHPFRKIIDRAKIQEFINLLNQNQSYQNLNPILEIKNLEIENIIETLEYLKGIFQFLSELEMQDDFVSEKPNFQSLISDLDYLKNKISDFQTEGYGNIELQELLNGFKDYIVEPEQFDPSVANSFITEKFEISIPDFFAFQQDIKDIFYSLTEESEYVIDMEKTIAENYQEIIRNLVLTVENNSRIEFLTDIQRLLEDVTKIKHFLLNDFQVSDLELIQQLKNSLNKLNLKSKESIEFFSKISINEFQDFQNFLNQIQNHDVLINLNLQEYSEIYNEFIANKNYNFLTFPFSKFRKKLKNINKKTKFTYQNFKKIKFQKVLKVFLTENFKSIKLVEIKEVLDGFVNTKEEYDEIIQPFIQNNKIYGENIIDVLYLAENNYFSNLTVFLKESFNGYPIHEFIPLIESISQINRQQIAIQNQYIPDIREDLISIIKIYLEPNFAFLPTNIPLTAIESKWFDKYEYIQNMIQHIADNNIVPYYFDNHISLKDFLITTKQVFYKLKLQEITNVSFDEIKLPENIANIDFEIPATVDIQNTINTLNNLSDLCSLLNNHNIEYIQDELESVNDFISFINDIYNEQNSRQNYINFLNSLDQLKEILTPNVFEHFEDLIGEVDSNVFKAVIINSIINFISNKVNWHQDNNNLLQNYKENAQNQMHNDYLKLRFQNHSELINNLRTGCNTPNFRISSTREKLIGGLFQDLYSYFSVFLATPENVADFIPAQENIFDYVIFDEASQVLIGEAIPSIYRGKKIIVVGDPDQMPPSTTFWLGNNENIVDEKSILDLFLLYGEHGWKVFDLQVHYRSKHHELFESSRSVIYPRTKPIVMANNYKPIISRLINRNIQDDNDKTHYESFTNYVKSIIENNENNCTYSVICMRADDATQLAGNFGENVLVRSLENMQGEEADEVFIFLNYKGTRGFTAAKNIWGIGGYKRLNVALTRARKRIHLLHTITLEEAQQVINQKITITLEEAQQVINQKMLSDLEDNRKSAEILTKFIELIRKHNPEIQPQEGNDNNLNNIKPPTVNENLIESPLERDFYDSFKEILLEIPNYTLVPQVSEGYFKIDFGIYDTSQNKYILGIELDGAAYHSDLEQIFYDSKRQKILEQMGWQIYRIWSTDWFSNPDTEVQNLRAMLNL